LKFYGWVAATGAALSASGASAQNSELFDYLVQDVCVDAQDRIVQGDPASCSRHRNLKLGERTPFLMTDWGTDENQSFFAWTSFPVRAEDGQIRVMVSRNSNNGRPHTPNFSFSFNQNNSGYDLIDLTYSGYASIIRTSDANCLDQLFSSRRRSPSALRSPASRAGGWILFPNTRSPSSYAATTSIINRTARTPIGGKPGCTQGDSLGATFWNNPRYYRYEGNENGQRKNLLTIRTDHFASRDLSSQNNALEMFLFTKEYGLTRWEAWQPRSRCIAETQGQTGRIKNCYPDNYPDGSEIPANLVNLRSRCKDLNVSGTSHPDISSWGGQVWVRVDCRDMTRHLPLNQPVMMLDSTMAQRNGVDDIDYAATVNPANNQPPSNPPWNPPGQPGFEIP
jgi:hypothetical protein